MEMESRIKKFCITFKFALMTFILVTWCLR